MKARIERKALRVLPMRCPFSCNSISISPRLARAFDIRSVLARLSILKCNFKSNPDPQNQRLAVSIPMRSASLQNQLGRDPPVSDVVLIRSLANRKYFEAYQAEQLLRLL